MVQVGPPPNFLLPILRHPPADLPPPHTPEDIASIKAGLLDKTLFTTTYSVVLPAACPTSAWTATYTISQVCSGDPATWTVPSILPSFDVTTVVCSVCEESAATQTINCPNALGTEPAVINGNGVTMTAAPTRTPGSEYGPGYAPGTGGKHPFGPGGTEAGGANWGAPGGKDGKAPVVTAGAASNSLKIGALGLVALVGGLFVL